MRSHGEDWEEFEKMLVVQFGMERVYTDLGWEVEEIEDWEELVK